MWHQPCQRCKYTTSVDIQNNKNNNNNKSALKKKSKKKKKKKELFTHAESHASAMCPLQSEERYIKAINNNNNNYQGIRKCTDEVNEMQRQAV